MFIVYSPLQSSRSQKAICFQPQVIQDWLLSSRTVSASGWQCGFLRRPNRLGPLHHAVGQRRCQDPSSSVLQLRTEGPGGRDRRLDFGIGASGTLLRHAARGRPRHQGCVGEHVEGIGSGGGGQCCFVDSDVCTADSKTGHVKHVRLVGDSKLSPSVNVSVTHWTNNVGFWSTRLRHRIGIPSLWIFSRKIIKFQVLIAGQRKSLVRQQGTIHHYLNLWELKMMCCNG